MVLSIIITSFRRANLLQWNLTALTKQVKDFSYEILVINDGIEDNTEEVCKQFSSQLNIRYIFTGQRNTNGIQWRIPGYAINIGAKQATGKSIIITCAEMFLLDDVLMDYVRLMQSNKVIVATDGKDDRAGKFLELVQRTNGNVDGYHLYDSTDKHDCMFPLNTDYPFFMGINRKEFIDIGGYDEDFIGYCWDDLDIVMRLKKNGCHQIKLPQRIVHLYHPRLRYGMEEVKEKWRYNETLYHERVNQIVRNEGKDWGKLDV